MMRWLVAVLVLLSGTSAWGQYYQIVDVVNEATGPLVHVDVLFWETKADRDAGKPWAAANTFRMQLYSTMTVPVRDEKGLFLTKGGKWVEGEMLSVAADPPVTQIVWRDNEADIRANIEAWWGRYSAAKATAKPFRSDGREYKVRLTRERSGVLIKDDVVNLAGRVFEVKK